MMKASMEDLVALDQWLERALSGDREAPPVDPDRARRLETFARELPDVFEVSPLNDPDWVSGMAAALAESGAVGPGARVGPFEIEQAIGAGGMGAVYRARRVEGGFDQVVALKVLAGSRPGPDSYKQFQRERQLLSRLSHPGIAHLIDGGMTEDWRPWFAMEFIDGVPIDRYARDQSLNVDERLKLFLQVCGALEYAHGRLVLHRDIKPSNILVTPEGQAKVVDFGLGQTLFEEDMGAESPPTSTMARWLTPDYASPEQVRGESITAVSEVYQMGLLLYRLLCDHPPYQVHSDNALQMMTSICEQRPLRPSQRWQQMMAVDEAQNGFPHRTERMPRLLQGDLDNIVLTALAKNPGNRYAGIADLAEDIRRHREHRPVRARAGTRRYRLAKFVRRYRKAVSAAAAVFALISAGLVIIALQALNLAEERNRALASAEENARLTEVLTGMVQIANVDAPGIEQITTIGDRLAQYVGHVRTELADEPLTRLHLLEVIGEAYEKLRDWPPAADVFDEAWSLANELLGATHERTLDLQAQLAQAVASIGEWERAEALLDELEAFYLDHYGPGDVRVAEVIFARAYLYEVRMPAGHKSLEGIHEQFAHALRIWQSVHEPPHEDLARGLHYLGLSYPDRDRGIEYLREGLAMSKAVLGEDHGMVARRKNDLALQLLAQGEMDETIKLIRRASELHAAAWGETHPQTLSMMSNLGGILQRAGEYEEAIEVYQANLARVRRVVDEDNLQVAFAANGLGMSKRESGQIEASEPWLREAVRVTQVNQSPLEGVARFNLAGTLIALDKTEEARAELEKALELNIEHFGTEHGRTTSVREALAGL